MGYGGNGVRHNAIFDRPYNRDRLSGPDHAAADAYQRAAERADLRGMRRSLKRGPHLHAGGMMQQSGTGLVLPAGTVPPVKLSGDELTVKIISTQDFEALVEYPDGYRRFHQAGDIITLLAKITGQLKGRYNLTSFEFKDFPQGLTPDATIKIGGITYA
jgi:hypothetical protein